MRKAIQANFDADDVVSLRPLCFLAIKSQLLNCRYLFAVEPQLFSDVTFPAIKVVHSYLIRIINRYKRSKNLFLCCIACSKLYFFL